jgi:hypothetical protein
MATDEPEDAEVEEGVDETGGDSGAEDGMRAGDDSADGVSAGGGVGVEDDDLEADLAVERVFWAGPITCCNYGAFR